MNRQQRFSFRKYKFGLASVLLGSVFVVGATQVHADEQAISTQTAIVQTSSIGEKEAPTDSAASPVEVKEISKVEGDIGVNEATTPSTQETTPTAEKATIEPNKAEEVTEPNSISSNEMISIPQTWKQGYKGEGMVVAVIDSGLDVEHEVLRISDASKAKFKNQEELEAAKKAAGIDYGKWYNDKVVFAYDYFDGTDNIKEKEVDSHGMHVTGIATGNPDKEAKNGEKIYGVAPEAQVMFMRVFSDRLKTTGSAIYVKAIDDAVALGADAINMSLGSATGSLVNAGPDIIEAIKRARAKGVSVLISAGNSNTFGNGHSKPAADNPDYGLVGNPSTVEESISVASINNDVLTSEVFVVRGLEDDDSLDNGKFDFNAPDIEAKFEKDKEYEYVAAGLGREDDFKDIDVTGKIALIQRGSLTFSEKIANAFHHGAVGALIYNNVDGANIGMVVEDDAKKIPSAFISKRYGEALKNGNYKVVFDGTMSNRPSEVADQLSAFTSWGVTTDGQLKPDVTAPGGNIYSSLNDNTYGNMSGTSMASPHVAGVAVLVKEYLLKHHPELTPEQVSETVKALIMSTAKPHKNKETGAYTSPRQQGAGLVDTAAAVSTDLYVTGENQYPSVTLGNVGDSFEFNVTVHNISDTDRTLKMIVNTNTDKVSDGLFDLAPRKLTETVWPNVTVKAHSSETVTVKVDASKFAEELTKEMPNGYFLEGFVRFVDPADDGDVVSLPFLGFRGEFQNLPAFEQPIYKLVRDGKNGFYYDIPEDKDVPFQSNITSVNTAINDLMYSTGQRGTQRAVVLGTTQTGIGKNILQLDAEGNVRLAISPNGDGNQDLVQFRGVAYRNVNNVRVSVYAASDTEHTSPVWEGNATDLRKNYYDQNPKSPRSYLLSNTVWKGVDAQGNVVADGLYDYVVSYTPDVPGADEQQTVFKLQIDTQKPVITSGYIRLQDGVQQFVARKPKDVGEGGIRKEQVFYLTAFDDNGTMVKRGLDTSGNIRYYENKTEIYANEDGSYTLPEGVDKANIYYAVEDFAGNTDYISLANLVREQNSGRFAIAVQDAQTHADLDTTYVYRIKDQAGNYVSLDKSKGINFLNFGHYTAEIFSYDRSELKFVSSLTQEFDLTEDDSFKTIVFYANVVDYAPVSLAFNQVLPKNTPIVLKNSDGEVFVLPTEKYGKQSFGKKVAVGHYTLVATLPTGYELEEENVEITVLAGRNNVYRISLVNKMALLAAVNQQSDLVQEAKYYNAASEKRAAYDKAYQLAQTALKTKESQSAIDQIVAELEAASKLLDGRESDMGALKVAMSAYDAMTRTGRYANAKEQTRRAYDRAFQAVALLAVGQNIRQEEIDQAVATLYQAENKLAGKETNFESLAKLIEGEEKYQAHHAKFIYASEKVKEAYLKAFRDAQAVLVNPGASQQDVKDAIAELKAAKKQLDGKKPKVAKRP